MRSLFCVTWTESDEVLGVREDGYSLHLTREDAAQFVEEYWATKPHEASQDYSVPDSEVRSVSVPRAAFRETKKSRNGVRKYRPKEPPFPQIPS